MSQYTTQVRLQAGSRKKRGLQVEGLERRALLASIAEFGLTTGSGPTSITSGPDGNLWFAESATSKIGTITTSGAVTEFALTSGSVPQAITTGPNGNLWFTEYGTDKIGEITTGGIIAEFALTTGSHPEDITTGPNGNLWFTERGTDKIGEIVPSGVLVGIVTEFALAANSAPFGITSGPNGNLWFTESGGSQVGQIVPSGTLAGTINTYSVAIDSGPEGITTGSDGNLWFTEFAGNNIGQVTVGGIVTEFPVPSTASSPTAIASGPLGDLYFTEANGNKIGQISTSGTFSEFTVPTASSSPAGIALGPDNHIWFTEYSSNQIGRLNLNPTAVNDSFTTNESTSANPLSLIVNAPGVLAVDSDPEKSTLSVASGFSQPSHGILTLSKDGSFTYTPTANYYGTDSFTYQATDGVDVSNTATVTITVNEVYSPPVAMPDYYSVSENTTFGPSGANVLTNDVDPQSLPLTVGNPGSTATAHGILNLGSDGTFNYTPNKGFTGTDTFTYFATDGHNNSNTATVTLTVINPLTVTGTTASATVGTLFTGNVASFTDANLTATISNLTATIQWGDSTNSLGTITQPGGVGTTFEVSGTHSFVTSGTTTAAIVITDNTNTASANTTITVAPAAPAAPAAPVAVNDSYSTPENTSLSTNPQTGVLANDTNYRSNSLTAILVDTTSHGALTLFPNGTFNYTPNTGFSGTDSFTYQASDGTNLSNSATVNLTVSNAPVAMPDNYTTTEGGTLTVNAKSGVLANDTNNSVNPLSAILVSTTTQGILTFNTDGSFTYVPDHLFYGTDSFSYIATDGSQNSQPVNVLIAVTPVPTPPVVANSSYSISEGSTLAVTAPGVLSGATDLDHLPLTASLVSGTTHGTLNLNSDGSFTYIPTAGYSGSDSFTYKANDGEVDSNVGTVTLTVAPTDHAPVALADQYYVASGTTVSVTNMGGILANDTSNNPLTALLVAGPSHGTLNLNPNGSFTYTSNNGYSGNDTFQYKATDGQMNSGVTTVTLTVNPPQVGPKPTPVAGDYNGDGKADIAVYLVNQASFAIRPSTGGPDVVVPFGIAGAGQTIPAPGDYFGTGTTDIAAYLPSTGAFAIRPSTGGPDVIVPFGIAGAGQTIPAPGDYDGSGKTEIAVYLPSLGEFAYRPANGGPDVIVPFGIAGTGKSIPMPGDYDGSGKTEFAVYMPGTGMFAYRPANGGPDVIEQFGIAGAGQTIPAPGDYTGVGHDQLAAYLPASGTFAIRPGGNQPDILQSFGIAGAGQTIPVTVVDQALAEFMPTTVTAQSIEIPNMSATTDPTIFPTTTTTTHNKKHPNQ